MSHIREVIQSVIEAETQAKRLVAAAKAEAEVILPQAEKQSQELLRSVQQETRAEVERLAEEATRQAEREKNECLAHAAAGIEAEVRLDEISRQRAVESILLCVCGLR